MIFFFLGFLFVFFNLFKNQSSYIFGGDSPEFLTTSLTYSIPHPPGYPLYTLLSILFHKLFFFLNPIYRLNLISILSSLATLIVLKKILSLLKINNFIILFSLLFFSFLYPIWLYSQVIEIYSLNVFFSSSLIYFGLKFIKTKKTKYLNFFYLIFGFGLTHHHSIIIYALPFFLIEKKFFSKSVILFFIPWLLYLYPVLASYFNPPLDWENAKTFLGLLRLISRYSYGTFSAYYNAIPNLVNQLTSILSTLILSISDFKPLGFFLIIVGFFNKDKFKKYLHLTLILYLIFLFISNFNLSQTFSLATFERYIIGFYLILIFYFSLGLNDVYNFLQRKIKKYKRYKTIYLVKPIFFLIIFFLLSNNYINNLKIIKNLKKINHFENLSFNIINIPEKNSILLLKSDITYFPISFFYYYKKQRNDLKLIFPPMFNRNYYLEKIKKYHPQIKVGTSLYQFIKKNSPFFKIYSEGFYPTGYSIPIGLLYKYYPDKKSVTKDLNFIVDFNYFFWKKNLDQIILNEDQKKILYLKALSEFYQEKLINYLKFLEDNKLVNELKKIKKGVKTVCPFLENDYQSIVCN
ncbi:MAG: DUF2723 domain-containing protein [Patescibacteria group bacterium]|nr:DUF2723 domain-containing protein [Patescibacteria group bacterium]